MSDRPEPGDRRPTGTPRPVLDRAPGERFGPPPTPVDGADAPPRSRSTARAVALGALAALAGSVVMVVLGGVFALSAGLLVISGLIGWAIGQVVSGAASPASTPRFRRTVAVTLAFDAVALAQVGLWLHARTQGGALGLLDYLAQTRGLLVPIELLIAIGVAWWATR